MQIYDVLRNIATYLSQSIGAPAGAGGRAKGRGDPRGNCPHLRESGFEGFGGSALYDGLNFRILL